MEEEGSPTLYEGVLKRVAARDFKDRFETHELEQVGSSVRIRGYATKAQMCIATSACVFVGPTWCYTASGNLYELAVPSSSLDGLVAQGLDDVAPNDGG